MAERANGEQSAVTPRRVRPLKPVVLVYPAKAGRVATRAPEELRHRNRFEAFGCCDRLVAVDQSAEPHMGSVAHDEHMNFAVV